MRRSTRSTTKQMTRDAFLGHDTSSPGRKKHHDVRRKLNQSSFLMWCVQGISAGTSRRRSGTALFHTPTHFDQIFHQRHLTMRNILLLSITNLASRVEVLTRTSQFQIALCLTIDTRVRHELYCPCRLIIDERRLFMKDSGETVVPGEL